MHLIRILAAAGDVDRDAVPLVDFTTLSVPRPCSLDAKFTSKR